MAQIGIIRYTFASQNTSPQHTPVHMHNYTMYQRALYVQKVEIEKIRIGKKTPRTTKWNWVLKKLNQ